jgi:hypothetical protein
MRANEAVNSTIWPSAANERPRQFSSPASRSRLSAKSLRLTC